LRHVYLMDGTYEPTLCRKKKYSKGIYI